MTAPARVRTFPVMEVFGPTIQGEGPDAGRPCHFVRFGGCDYSCSWCDSWHAVDPASVRANAEKLTAVQIADRLDALADGPDTIVLSGGNPALLRLDDLVDELHDRGYRVAVETQGSRSPGWLATCDLVVVSPKPPTSGMTTDWNALERTVWLAHDSPAFVALKVVVGSDEDYAFARLVHERFPTVPFYLSVLNPDGSDEAFDIGGILAAYRDLCERVASDPMMRNARVMPQLHTLAWGNEKER